MPSRRTPDPFAAQLGERIRQLRKEKKMSLHELARASGISRGHLSDLEQGKVVMTIGTLGKLGHGLETPPFMICLVPTTDIEVAGVERALADEAGDVKGAAEKIRAAAFEGDEKKSRDSDE